MKLPDYPQHLNSNEMSMYRRWSEGEKEDFHERVAIIMHDAKQTEQVAEKLAFTCVQMKHAQRLIGG